MDASKNTITQEEFDRKKEEFFDWGSVATFLLSITILVAGWWVVEIGIFPLWLSIPLLLIASVPIGAFWWRRIGFLIRAY